MSARAFGFTLRYRPVGPDLVGPDGPDQRPVERLPSLSGPASADNAAARESALIAECQQLESQGYRIEQVERWNDCRKCHGSGKVEVRPKGWKRRTPPAWYEMRRLVCQDCGGGGAEHQVESVQTIGAAEGAAS